MKSGSSEFIGSGGQTGETLAASSCHHKSRPSFIGTLAPVRRTTTTCSTTAHLSTALSTIDLESQSDPAHERTHLVAIVLPPRLPSSVVMTTRALQSTTRSRRASALKPAKTTEWTAPMRAQARKAMAASGTAASQPQI